MAHKVKHEVKSKGKLVKAVEVDTFDTLGEMVQALGSEGEVLKLANTQYATNIKNEIRRLASSKLSETKARSLAVDRVANSTDQLQRVIAGEATFDQLVAAEVELVKAEFEASRAMGEPVEAAANDDSEDEEAEE